MQKTFDTWSRTQKDAIDPREAFNAGFDLSLEIMTELYSALEIAQKQLSSRGCFKIHPDIYQPWKKYRWIKKLNRGAS